MEYWAFSRPLVQAGQACLISFAAPLLCRPGATRSAAQSGAAIASLPAVSSTGSAKHRAQLGRRAGGSTRPRAGRVVVPPVAAPAAVDAERQAQAVLSVILGVISSLGGTAAADQPFMEAGVDSLGEPARVPHRAGLLLRPSLRHFSCT